MKIDDARLFVYKTSFRRTQEMRRGLLLALCGNGGKMGWGEISPLRNWSIETFEQAKEQLEMLCPLLVKDPNADFIKNLYPSVQFGISSALFHLNESSTTAFSLPLSGLLQGSYSEILEEAKQLKKEGIQTVKLKVSSLSFSDAEKLIHVLKEQFILRIDVNRAWSYKDAVSFFSHFSPETFEYIEEPIDRLEDLSQFPYPFALDESLKPMLEINPSLSNLPFLKALVVKPTLLGDLSFLFPFQKKGILIVLSSCYESGVGLYAIANIAKSLSLLSHSHGLDTSRYLTQDILKTPLKISNGYLHVPDERNDVSSFYS